MKTINKTKKELLDANERLKAELSELKNESFINKKIEDALSLERKLYFDLTNALPYGLYRIRVFAKVSSTEERWQNTKDAPFHFEFINDRFCEILSIKKEVFEKNPEIIIDSVYEEDKADFAKKNAEANLKLIPFKWEGRFNIQEKITWVHFESLPSLLENGDVIWTGIFFDNNEQKNAEQEIKQKNEELKKINSEKDKFFSIIAHDLKSPFNSIMGFSELLAKKIRLNDAKGIEEYAEIILNSSQKAISLLMNLTEWSQSQTGRMNFHPENFEINNVVDEIILLFEEIANQKKITFLKLVPPRISVHADKAMIHTVFRNLVSNALKFTLPEGEITISAKVHNKEINISVTDTGVGIPTSAIKKIFSLDENYTTYGTQNEKGTGLGLILCKEFIEKHNGDIWAESELNKGSTFHFTIPLIDIN